MTGPGAQLSGDVTHLQQLNREPCKAGAMTGATFQVIGHQLCHFQTVLGSRAKKHKPTHFRFKVGQRKGNEVTVTPGLEIRGPLASRERPWTYPSAPYGVPVHHFYAGKPGERWCEPTSTSRLIQQLLHSLHRRKSKPLGPGRGSGRGEEAPSSALRLLSSENW